ncbi:MAG: hypothetical protein PWR03_788 [Tenuifilum sp.]|uniref:DUF5020 family protein n=1 Tax=Tenuifilum sp. TaxID=2760880 RepID=UPI0024AB1E3C|nr:DUF5020 family protein [Tenuifilum sp.]MDI3526605.1 hypothetical protein [Tenuifilum sp.]
MRKLILFISFASFFFVANSQNVQLHYDFGKDRKMFTSTVEMFKPDSWGNTFFFVDFDYGSKSSGVDGVSLAYWEISRELKFWEAPIAFHAEFNGGFGQFNIAPNTNGAYTINNAYLFGPSFSWNNSSFTRGFTLQTLFKYITDKEDASFQITGVWYMHFLDGMLTFSGFADIWKEDNVVFDDNGNTSNAKFVFLAEPQIWYNTTKNLSLGGEIEISSNFGGNKGFMVNPTLAVKWQF